MVRGFRLIRLASGLASSKSAHERRGCSGFFGFTSSSSRNELVVRCAFLLCFLVCASLTQASLRSIRFSERTYDPGAVFLPELDSN